MAKMHSSLVCIFSFTTIPPRVPTSSPPVLPVHRAAGYLQISPAYQPAIQLSSLKLQCFYFMFTINSCVCFYSNGYLSPSSFNLDLQHGATCRINLPRHQARCKFNNMGFGNTQINQCFSSFQAQQAAAHYSANFCISSIGFNQFQIFNGAVNKYTFFFNAGNIGHKSR